MLNNLAIQYLKRCGVNKMRDSLLEKYKLQKRLEVIESLITERSIGRGGEPSNAMKVWQLLTDNGPMTKQQIQSRVYQQLQRLQHH